jgi:hypothetical protein
MDPSDETEAVEITTRSGARQWSNKTEEENLAADRAVVVAAEEAFSLFDDEPETSDLASSSFGMEESCQLSSEL